MRKATGRRALLGNGEKLENSEINESNLEFRDLKYGKGIDDWSGWRGHRGCV